MRIGAIEVRLDVYLVGSLTAGSLQLRYFHKHYEFLGKRKPA